MKSHVLMVNDYPVFAAEDSPGYTDCEMARDRYTMKNQMTHLNGTLWQLRNGNLVYIRIDEVEGPSRGEYDHGNDPL